MSDRVAVMFDGRVAQEASPRDLYELPTSQKVASFIGEMTSVVKNSSGEIVEGDSKQIKRQKDTWTFSKDIESSNPNWLLVATGE